MTRRTSIFVLVGALTSCFLLAACVGLFGVGYYFYSANVNPFAALRVPAPASLNRIAFVGNDSNIYVANPMNGELVALTTDGSPENSYNYPTWSPDSHRVAFVGYTFENGRTKESALYTVSPTGAERTSIFRTTQNFPFYLYWSPDSQFVSFLANKDSQNIALYIARRDEPDSNQEIDFGSPFYWAWAPDASQLFTHVGGARSENERARMEMLSLNNADAKRPLDAAPGSFQAPQWSRTGKILYSTQDAAAQAIALGDAASGAVQKLATYRGRASFALAPDEAHVAYLLTDAQTRLPHFGQLRVVQANGANAQLISQEPALAFLWSPDSSKLAYLTVSVGDDQSNFNFQAAPPLAAAAPEKFFREPQTFQGGELQIQLHWQVWERASNTSRTIASFAPTSSFLNIIPYFDQYANSSTFWSPDSQAFVYTARESETGGSVFIADAVGNNPPRKIGDGLLAFWSWR